MNPFRLPAPYYQNDLGVLYHGDALDILPNLEPADAIVTDPPYGLQFMGKKWDKLWRNKTEADNEYVEKTKGTLTSRQRKLPDYNATDPQQMQEWHYRWAKEILRVAKPGAFMLAFGGPERFTG